MMTSSRPIPHRIGPGLTAALGYIAMAGALSTDLYLPAFPDLVDDLSATASVVQLTLTGFLIGSALGQLLIGSISDAFGRRRTLLTALAVFTVCGFVAAASPTVSMLIAIRCVQGFAGAAGAVLARAIVADLSEPRDAVRAFSRLWIMIALGPAVASPLGALLTQWGGWRAALLGLAVLATGMLAIAALLIPESLPPELRHPSAPRAVAGRMLRLVRQRRFVGWVLAFAAGYAALMTYIASSSFIVQHVLDIGPVGYGLTFTVTSLAVMFGAWLSGRLATRLSGPATLRFGQALAVAAAIVAGVLALTDTLTLVSYLLLMVVFCTGCGTMMSTGSALAVSAAGATAGTGSALLGFGQFLFGAVASPLGGIAGTDTAVPALIVMAVCPLIGFAGLVTATAGRLPDGRSA